MTFKKLIAAASLATMLACADNSVTYRRNELTNQESHVAFSGGASYATDMWSGSIKYNDQNVVYRNTKSTHSWSGGESGDIFSKRCYSVEILGYEIDENADFVKVKPLTESESTPVRKMLQARGVKGALEQECER